MNLQNKAKERKVIRSFFTRTANELDAILLEKWKEEAHMSYKKLESLNENLKKLDAQIQEFIIKDYEEEDLEKEISSQLEYQTRWMRLDAQYQKKRPSETPKKTPPNMHLPKLQPQTFDGDLKNWLSFWAQFNKIDKDPTLDVCDKYGYLLQAMKEHTEVRKMVENFPASAYEDCLVQLKQRYAREDLLIQIYIREILALVLTEKKGNITELYDKLNAQLRAIETLNVTKEKYAVFLLPMVESSLPQDILRIWERSKQPCKNVSEELTNVLEFLRKEVESEQRIEMSKRTFGKEIQVESTPST